MIYGSFFFKDWIANAKILKMSEHLEGVYFRLLCQQFQCDGYLPRDKNEILLLVKRTTTMEDVETILDIYFELDENGYYNQKMLDTYHKAVSYSKSQTEKGKKGGRPRKAPAKPAGSSGKSPGLSRGQSPAKANHESMNPCNHESIKPKKTLRAEALLLLEFFHKERERQGYGTRRVKDPKHLKAAEARMKEYTLEEGKQVIVSGLSDKWRKEHPGRALLFDLFRPRNFEHYLHAGSKPEAKKAPLPKLPELKKAQALWKMIVKATDNFIGKENYDTWLAKAKPVGIKNKNTLVILLPNSTFTDWISEYYLEEMNKAAPEYKILLTTESRMQSKKGQIS